MKKSGFLTFILALIPGCGLMYLGYMKKGLQTMLMFATACYLAYAFASPRYFQWIMVLFISLLPVIWFYQMFDSMHTISRMKRQEIEVPLDDGFYIPAKINTLSPAQNPLIAKIIAISLILIGSFSLLFGILDNLDKLHYFFNRDIAKVIISTLRSYLIPTIISIALIIAGVKLLKGSKPKFANADDVSGGSDLS
jgi:Flp pilus assembly pilin Flp